VRTLAVDCRPRDSKRQLRSNSDTSCASNRWKSPQHPLESYHRMQIHTASVDGVNRQSTMTGHTSPESLEQSENSRARLHAVQPFAAVDPRPLKRLQHERAGPPEHDSATKSDAPASWKHEAGVMFSSSSVESSLSLSLSSSVKLRESFECAGPGAGTDEPARGSVLRAFSRRSSDPAIKPSELDACPSEESWLLR